MLYVDIMANLTISMANTPMLSSVVQGYPYANGSHKNMYISFCIRPTFDDALMFATFDRCPLELVRMVLDGECRPDCAERGWSWLVSRALNLVRLELMGSCRVLG